MGTQISDRQLEIIEAAGKILTESGISGLTIKNLAKEMKFTESAIYRHFVRKEDIIIALLEYLAKSMDERLATSTSSLQTADEKLTELFRSQFSFFKKNPHFVVAVFSEGLMEASQRINETILNLMAIKMKHLMPIIMEGQQKQVFTDAIISNELIHIVVGTFRLQMFNWRVANFQYDIQSSGENMIQSIQILIKKCK
ncbi:MAG: TetR/AcrR family transcriptional regulator [Saprospiraceae bacterium]|nr:TetR/AcrR family transcriptional regulator [Saprospiraceae bacterium]